VFHKTVYLLIIVVLSTISLSVFYLQFPFRVLMTLSACVCMIINSFSHINYLQEAMHISNILHWSCNTYFLFNKVLLIFNAQRPGYYVFLRSEHYKIIAEKKPYHAYSWDFSIVVSEKATIPSFNYSIALSFGDHILIKNIHNLKAGHELSYTYQLGNCYHYNVLT